MKSKDPPRYEQYFDIFLVGFPSLVLVEYSGMMANILDYIGSYRGNKDEKIEKIQGKLLKELSWRLNSLWATLLWICLIHTSMLTFDVGHILFLHSSIFILMIAYKLFIYCRFMDSQHT